MFTDFAVSGIVTTVPLRIQYYTWFQVTELASFTVRMGINRPSAVHSSRASYGVDCRLLEFVIVGV